MATKIFNIALFILVVVLSYLAYKDGHPDMGIVFAICFTGYWLTHFLEYIVKKHKAKTK